MQTVVQAARTVCRLVDGFARLEMLTEMMRL
jgi:hypothetical protein